MSAINNLKNNFAIKTTYQISLSTQTPVYLVGGAVRDALMGSFIVNDADFAVGEGAEDIVSTFAEMVNGRVIPWDFSQTRIVFKEKGRYVSVDFSRYKGSDIIGDLEQRDFNINSMAVGLNSLMEDETPEIIDPLQGRRDIEKKIIRVCKESSFDSDPLRILRGIRFAREFGFSIEMKTFELMKKKSMLIEQVSRERIIREFFSILDRPDLLKSIEELREAGIMNRLIPELEKMAFISQGPPHQYNLLEHSLKTVQYLRQRLDGPEGLVEGYDNQIETYFKEQIQEGVTRRSLLMFAGLLHDSGKMETKRSVDGKVAFYGHEKQGALLNRTIAKRLGLGKQAQRMIGQVTENHMRLLQLSQLSKITMRAKLRLLKDCKATALETLLLAVSDSMATSTDNAFAEKTEKVKYLVRELAEKIMSIPEEVHCAPILKGREVMDLLGITEGPEVGAILREAFDRERAGLFNSRQDALEWLKQKKIK
jgi:tRNA nucleotidyltransferase/poly(A) polymerase